MKQRKRKRTKKKQNKEEKYTSIKLINNIQSQSADRWTDDRHDEGLEKRNTGRGGEQRDGRRRDGGTGRQSRGVYKGTYTYMHTCIFIHIVCHNDDGEREQNKHENIVKKNYKGERRV